MAEGKVDRRTERKERGGKKSRSLQQEKASEGRGGRNVTEGRVSKRTEGKGREEGKKGRSVRTTEGKQRGIREEEKEREAGTWRRYRQEHG